MSAWIQARQQPCCRAAFGSGDYGAYNQGPIATIAGGPWTHMGADVRFPPLRRWRHVHVEWLAKVLVPEPGTFALGLLFSLGVAVSLADRSRRS